MCYDVTVKLFITISIVFFIFVIISLLSLVVSFDYFKRTQHKLGVTLWCVFFMVAWTSVCVVVVINHCEAFNNQKHYLDCSKEEISSV